MVVDNPFETVTASLRCKLESLKTLRSQSEADIDKLISLKKLSQKSISKFTDLLLKKKIEIPVRLQYKAIRPIDLTEFAEMVEQKYRHTDIAERYCKQLLQNIQVIQQNYVVKEEIKEKTKKRGKVVMWTDEETARLLQLLDYYPEEEVAFRRYEKIARELGTRSASQIASRVQRYHHRLTNIRLYASDDDIMDQMEIQRQIRIMDAATENVHYGFSCNSCDLNPIVGTRWKCATCQDIDLCNSCKILGSSIIRGQVHDATHRFVPISNENSCHGEYSYLNI